MPDYSKGKIYMIRCRTDDTLIYVGSTIQSLAVRWGGHKKDSKKERCKDILIYKTINDDWENWYIELYELYPCSCKAELERKEGEIIRLIGTLNSRIEGRTRQEYSEDHKEEIKEYQKEYRENNKEKKLEQAKEYYQNNKEKLLEQIKEYYQNNKKEILEKKTQKITCECGCITVKPHLNRHKKTQKHINWVNNQTDLSLIVVSK
jgi:Uri superfamily endonuclease